MPFDENVLLISFRTPGTLWWICRNRCRSFGGNARCDLGGSGFPYCHLLGDAVALLALDSSPFEPGVDPAGVKGRITAAQLARLEALAGHERLRGRFLVLLLHHRHNQRNRLTMLVTYSMRARSVPPSLAMICARVVCAA